MKKTICALLCLILLSATAAWGQQDLKVGVLNLRDVITQSEPGRDALTGLKGEFEPMAKDIEERKAEYEELVQEIEKQRLVLSGEAMADKELELQRKQRDLNELVQLFQRKRMRAEEEASKPILDKLVDVVKEYGEANGYTLIIDRHQSGLIFVEDKVDITDAIIVELNRAWKAGN